MPTPRHRLLPFVAALSALPLVACGAHSHGSNGPLVFFEQEPNGSVNNPDFIDWVDPTTFLLVEGHVQAFGPDQLDGFRFITTQPMTIHVAIYADAFLADIDLCVYDPDFDSFIVCLDSPHGSEEGSFSVLEAGKAFDLVVETFVSGTSYTIEVNGYPLALGATEAGGPQGDDVSPITNLAAAQATPTPDKDSRREQYRKLPDEDPEPAVVLRRGVAILIDGDGEVLPAVPWIARVER